MFKKLIRAFREPSEEWYDAAYQGDVVAMERHWQSWFDVDYCFYSTTGVGHYATLLTKLLMTDRRAIVAAEWLIRKGADVHKKSAGGYTPLHTAASNGNAPAIQVLLNHGAGSDMHEKTSIHNHSGGLTPLHMAAASRDVDAIRILLNNGAISDIHEKTAGDSTPLHCAIGMHPFSHNAAAIRVLLEYGAIDDIHTKDKSGRTPLHCAATTESLEIIPLLLAHGAGSGIHEKTARGDTVLHLAALVGKTDNILLLLENGALSDIHEQDEYGYTPLHYAVKGGHVPAIQLLLGHGAVSDIHRKNRWGVTPLHLAAGEANISVIQLLFEYGAVSDIHEKTSGSCEFRYWGYVFHAASAATPLHLATKKQNVQAIQLLLAHGAASDVNETDSNGYTPLHLISKATSESYNIFNILLRAGANIHAADHAGRTPAELMRRLGITNQADYLDDIAAGRKTVPPAESGTEPWLESLNSSVNNVAQVLKPSPVCSSSDEPIMPSAPPAPITTSNSNVYASSSEQPSAPMYVPSSSYSSSSLSAGQTRQARKIPPSIINTLLESSHALIKKLGLSLQEQPSQLIDMAIHTIAEQDVFEQNSELRTESAEIQDFYVESTVDAVKLELGYIYKQIRDFQLEETSLHALNDNKSVQMSAPSAPIGVASVSNSEDSIIYSRSFTNVQDNVNALMEAARNGDNTTIDHLVSIGTDINVRNYCGDTALLQAARHGHHATIKHLVGHGADGNAKNNNGRSALLLAASNGHHATIDYLVGHGADVNAKDNFGYTALLLAASNGHHATIDHLVSLEVDVNAKGEDGNTALMLAAYKGHHETIDHLVQHGADVNAKNNRNQTALMGAASRGHNAAIDHLADHGADVNARSNDGHTALMFAVVGKHYGDINATIDYLVTRFGIDMHAKDQGGRTALLFAAANGRSNAIDHLVKHYGIDVYVVNDDGDSALHRAAYKGCEMTVNHLLQSYQFDIHVKNNKGQTPAMLAREAHHIALAEHLEAIASRTLPATTSSVSSPTPTISSSCAYDFNESVSTTSDLTSISAPLPTPYMPIASSPQALVPISLSTQPSAEPAQQLPVDSLSSASSVTLFGPSSAVPAPVRSLADLRTLIEAADADAPEHLCDPVSYELMTNPVTLMQTAQVFQKESIEACLTKKMVDPVTNEVITNTETRPASRIRAAVEIYLKGKGFETIDEYVNAKESTKTLTPGLM